MEDDYTTIRIPKTTLKQIEDLKLHPSEPYHEVIERHLNKGKVEEDI